MQTCDMKSGGKKSGQAKARPWSAQNLHCNKMFVILTIPFVIWVARYTYWHIISSLETRYYNNWSS